MFIVTLGLSEIVLSDRDDLRRIIEYKDAEISSFKELRRSLLNELALDHKHFDDYKTNAEYLIDALRLENNELNTELRRLQQNERKANQKNI